MASFGSLVPGMAPMPIPQMRPNAMLQQGMRAMNMARAQQRQPGPGGQPGQPPQGLLQRLLNPAAPPQDLAAPGLTPGSGTSGAGGPMQMGLLAKLFPGLMGQQPGPPVAGMAPGGVMPPAMPPNALGGLY